ncbi:ABC transporter ATP-binding protein [Paenibacillus spiritus]|uniref:ABC transporter ATP-binding protein n=1 Tax=Paenibacillus spiritus TaxID=2496557 RepID=A0A5J5G295_9BACL|nr:ABC transporter ATP-binding protein [Paenibacillus spiritus]KAA9000978.1 ABC transporter ATP-binding protein [Paenibacillus spiritus]
MGAKPDTIPSAGAEPASAQALEVLRLGKTFRNGRTEVPALRDITLHVAAGEFVSVLGPSGCGKSTLFQIIGGLLHPDAGSVRMDGEEVTGKRGRIAYMPQQPALFPWRTMLDNVLLAREIAGGVDAAAREEAAGWLTKAGLGGYERSYPHMLSGGMQQRTAFVRALLSPQELMLLDEPFSALDALTRSDMQRWLLEMWEETRRSVLFITHSIEEALLLSSRIYIFSNRPGTVLHEIEVPFPRPRPANLADDPEFIRLRRRISDWMTEEQQRP